MTDKRKIALGLGLLAGVGTLVYLSSSPKKAGAAELPADDLDALPDGVPPQAQPFPGGPVVTVEPGDIDGTAAPAVPQEVELEPTPEDVLEAEEAEAQEAAAADAEADEEEAGGISLPEPIQSTIEAARSSLPPELQAALPSSEQIEAQVQAAATANPELAEVLQSGAQQASAAAEQAADEAEEIAAADEPEDVPDDTVALAQLMLEEEGRANWKRRIPELAAWQEARGLTPDQKFGPKSAVAMAQEIGTVPIVRFWSHWDKAKSVRDYRADLSELASNAPPGRAAQLRSSAMRETGQAYDRNPGPVSPLFTLELA